MHAEHPEKIRVVRVESSQAHERRDDRNALGPRETPQHVRAVRVDDPPADVQYRSIGGENRLCHSVYDFLRNRRERSRGVPLHRRVPGVFTLVHLRELDISGNVDQNRARPSAPRDGESAPQNGRDFARVADLPGRAHDSARHGQDIDFLKRVRADQPGRHLAGDRHQRNRIGGRVRERCQEIRRARAGRGQAHRRRTRGPRHAVRDKGRALFVPRENMAHGTLIQRVI